MIIEISNIEGCYNQLKVTDYWEQPSTQICIKIVKFLNEYIKSNPNSARAYYLRSMAKFHLTSLIPPDYFWHDYSEYAKGKTYNRDEAWEDYNTAISIDTDIAKKNPDVRVIMASCVSGKKYYFRKPCTRKDLDKMLTHNGSISLWIGILDFIIVISWIIGNIFHFTLPDKYLAPFAFVIFAGLILIVIMNIYRRKISKNIEKLHKELCEEVVDATWAEIK